MTWLLSLFQDYSLGILLISLIGCVASTLIPSVGYRTPALIVCLLVALSAIYLKGGNDERVKRDLIEEKAKTEVALLQKQQEEITAKYNAIAARNRELIKENGRLKNVNIYVSQEDDDKCVLPPGFIRLHNEAASGKLSNTP
jgi:hypothetical protein